MKIALFNGDPVCTDATELVLSQKHTVVKFDKLPPLDLYDMIAMPGGVEDADEYHEYFGRKDGNRVEHFLNNGGKYLGICLGAYWAGHYYFDILDGIYCEQYIKQPNAKVKRSFETTIEVDWLGQKEQMYFFDGTTFKGDINKSSVVASYSTGEPMAIVQNNIGLIGCHPESQLDWYDRKYLSKYWHNGKHNSLLLDFVDRI
jgi:glutamine amidotransferase-like uncharacterized protein